MSTPKPEFITFTGMDDRTDLTRADKLAARYPIEWGILMSDYTQDARFPSNQAIAEIADITGRKSAHLCGDFATIISSCGTIPSSVTPVEKFQRIQVNGLKARTKTLMQFAAKADIDVIVQTRGQAFNTTLPCFELFDCSGGRGRFPEIVPPLPGEKTLVGYSGGMGPESVTDYLKLITGSGRFWIDMEQRVRTGGWFDLDLVERVCQQVFDS